MTKGYKPELPTNVPEKGQVFKHYKGDLYEIVGLAIHSNDDTWMVVYKPLYVSADAEMFTRPLSEWGIDIEWEGKRVKRFSQSKI